MISVRGQRYGVLELTRKVRAMPLKGLVRNVGDSARGPLRRLQVVFLPVAASPLALSRRLGFRSSERMTEYFREETFAAWLTRPSRNKELADAIATTRPEAVEDAMERGETLLRHQFELLGSGPVQLGENIDWLCDFKTGTRWEPGFFRNIDVPDWRRPSDVKVPWELSRSHHLVDLARAFLLTQDRRYVDEIAAQWRSWLAMNPLGYSVNWACTMDVAIRAVNWIWCLAVVAPELETDVLAAVVASLHQHGSFIAANLERSEVNGNHYVADAVGLVAVGAVFGRWRQGRRWLERGGAILVEELPKQVYPDGVDHEMSVPYHRLVAEIFLTGFLVMRAAGHEPPTACWARLRRMGAFTAAYTRPDGSAPVWGDADDGRLQRFGAGGVNDHRHLLSTMAVVFADPALRATAGELHEDTLWLLGAGAGDEFARLAADPAQESVAEFRDAGFVVLRLPNAHVLFDAGPVGLRGRGGHGHNDALAFELWADGIPLIIDPGAHVYTADPVSRNRFRSTAAHNSPMLGTSEMAELGDERNLWTIADQARATVDEVGSKGSTCYVAGHHKGYTRLQSDAIVHRRLELDDINFRVIDEVPSAAPGWSITLTLGPAVDVVSVVSPHRAVVGHEAKEYILTFHGAAKVEAVATHRSPSYGVIQPAAGLRVTFPGGRLVTHVALAAGATAA